MPRTSGKALSKKQRKQVLTIAKRTIATRQELKHFDASVVNEDAIDTGAIWSLSDVPQGDTDITRTGDELFVRSFNFTLQVSPATTQQIARIILFRWKPLSGDYAPTTAEILESVSSVSYLNWDSHKAGHFNVLLDRQMWIPGSTAVTSQSYRFSKRMYFGKALKGRKVIFDNASTTDGADKFYVLIMSTKATSQGPTVNISSRLEYYDS